MIGPDGGKAARAYASLPAPGDAATGCGAPPFRPRYPL
jgi:hypothetical protein